MSIVYYARVEGVLPIPDILTGVITLFIPLSPSYKSMQNWQHPLFLAVACTDWREQHTYNRGHQSAGAAKPSSAVVSAPESCCI